MKKSHEENIKVNLDDLRAAACWFSAGGISGTSRFE